MRLGERLHLLRTSRGLTLEDIGTAIGSSKQQIFRIEKGQIPSADTLLKLATFLEVSADYLLGLVNEPHDHLKPADLTPQEKRFLNAIRDRTFEEVLHLLMAFMESEGENVNGGAA